MIPKKIHYCWFGGNPLPELAVKCIESWKKYCPDYEIIEWNESNFDVNCCQYTKEAYEAKKWAFVSDYARFKILYEHGGLYFDTDVEIIKPLDDIINKGAFMGIEDNNGNKITINPGLGLGADCGLEIYKELVEAYHKRRFINEDGTLNLTTVVMYTTEILRAHGLEDKNEMQLVEGVYIYPKDYFCPKDNISGRLNLTENSYTIHHYDGSWTNDEDEYAKNLRKKIFKIVPIGRIASGIARIIAIIRYRGFKEVFKEIKNRQSYK